MDYKEYTVKVNANGDKAWYVNDVRHREDGPAIECVHGFKAWYLNGKIHREDGPAVEYTNGDKYWFIDGKNLTEEQFNIRINKIIVIDGKTYKLVPLE